GTITAAQASRPVAARRSFTRPRSSGSSLSRTTPRCSSCSGPGLWRDMAGASSGDPVRPLDTQSCRQALGVVEVVPALGDAVASGEPRRYSAELELASDTQLGRAGAHDLAVEEAPCIAAEGATRDRVGLGLGAREGVGTRRAPFPAEFR